MSKEQEENIFDRLAANPIPGAKPPKYRPQEVSETLFRAIEQSGRTAYDLAKAAKMEPDLIYRFMAGNDIRLSTVDKLAQELGLELKPIKRTRRPKQ